MNTVPNPSTLPPRILMLISYFRQYVSAYVKRSNLVHLLGMVVQAARGLQGGGQDGRRLEMENVQKATLINFQLRKNGRPGKLEAMASFSLQEVKNSYQPRPNIASQPMGRVSDTHPKKVDVTI